MESQIKLPRSTSAGFARVYKHIPFLYILLAIVLSSIAIPVITAVTMTIVNNNSLNKERATSQSIASCENTRAIIAADLANIEDVYTAHGHMIESGDINFGDIAGSSRRALAMLRASNIAFMTFVEPTGSAIDVLAIDADRARFGVFLQDPTRLHTCQYEVTDFVTMAHALNASWCIDGNFSDILAGASASFVPDIYNATEATWSNIVPVYTSEQLLECFAFVGTSRAPDGSPVFHNVGWTLGLIGAILRGVTVSDGFGFIVDARSLYYFGSTLAGDDSSQMSSRVTIDRINITEIAQARVQILAIYGDWSRIPRETTSHWIDGSRILSTTHVTRAGLDWVFVTVSKPRMQMVQWQVVGVILAIAIAMAAIGTVFSMRITRIIAQISRAIDDIINLRFDEAEIARDSLSIEDFSIVREFRGLQKRFKRLSHAVKGTIKYVPRSVVRSLMRDDDRAILPVKTAGVAIMFVDIVGFTTLSEQLSSNQVVTILSLWFDEFVEIIDKNGGTVDKFIGDCIMAIYGAPDAVDHPAERACNTAQEFAHKLASVRATIEAALVGTQSVRVASAFSIEAAKSALEIDDVVSCASMSSRGDAAISGETLAMLRAFNVRVGIGMGNVLAGSIGSKTRVNYTVCGNIVNVASRLEQLGREYGLSPLVGENIAETAKNSHMFVFIDDRKVKGHHTTNTRIYHLACEDELANIDDAREVFGRLHALIEARDIAGAREYVDAQIATHDQQWKYACAMCCVRDAVRD